MNEAIPCKCGREAGKDPQWPDDFYAGALPQANRRAKSGGADSMSNVDGARVSSGLARFAFWTKRTSIVSLAMNNNCRLERNE